ncbi:ferredoxin--NADP reductase [Roseateles sp. PN1]|uniref:ferredoxin--NADP reductase n=1 Tax=Roseateles sp. PN1 TaxID=3137372 RepID=UPI003138CB0B
MAEAKAGGSRYHALRVSAVIDETHDAKSLVFEVPAELATQFRYAPGQFLTLRLPVDGRQLLRCYSMSSAPGLDAAPRVSIKRVQGGCGSNYICDKVKAGDRIEVMAPAGVFTPRSLDTDFLLLAGGSGITPVFSILRSALTQGQGRITLLYANRDERSVIFRDELKALAAAHPTRLQVIHWLDSVQGVPSVAQLAELAKASCTNGRQAFICGPAPFMDAAVAALQAIEMPSDLVHVERFASLPDEQVVAANAAAAQAELLPDAVPQARLGLRLDGVDHELICQGSETILDAALAAGLNPPYACQAGMCASCMCQVIEGSVHMRLNESLDKKDQAKGWVLSCQAVPTSERLRVKFPE